MAQTSKKSRRANPQPDIAPNRLPDDLRREDAPRVPSGEIPPADSGGGLVPAGDGEEENPDRPKDDADPEDDATPGDHEWEIIRLDLAARLR